MDKTILVGLTGHTQQFRLDVAAYDRLAQYLDRAALRLRDDPDRAEILQDLERSIGDRLASLPGLPERLFGVPEIDAVLEDVGTVDTGRDVKVDEEDLSPRPRRLQRIREGQMIAGVCTGLAAYAELDVAWVRTLFVIGTVFTAGILALVYVTLVFVLPIAPRREALR